MKAPRRCLTCGEDWYLSEQISDPLRYFSRVKRYVRRNGERFATVLEETGIPAYYPTSLALSRRPRGVSAETLAAEAADLAHIGLWAAREQIELLIAGLMSDKPAAEVAGHAKKMIEAMAACGCTMNNAYMQHSLLALVLIPELRISDLGLVDVTEFRLTPVVEV